MGKKWFVSAGIAALVGGILAAGGPMLNASGAAALTFTTTIDNPYYPVTPGTSLIYKGKRDGQTQVDRVKATDLTRTVASGVEVRVVVDVAKHHSILIEKTRDWFAQDSDGNVWYFGENTAEYAPDGTVISTEGSWEDGVDGAVAGIIMEADPQVPDAYRQEFYAGQAEDTAWVVQRDVKAVVPYGTFHDALRSLEFTALEPKVIDSKYYVPGIGIVLEKAEAGGQEVARLVNVITG